MNVELLNAITDANSDHYVQNLGKRDVILGGMLNLENLEDTDPI